MYLSRVEIDVNNRQKKQKILRISAPFTTGLNKAFQLR